MAHGYSAIGQQEGYTNSASGALSFQDFYEQQGYGSGNPYDFWHKIGNFFSGNVSSAENAYQNYLANYEYNRNQAAVDKYNQETWHREDTAIQRLMKDYEAAGLNPYLILNSGGAGNGAVTTQANAPTYKRSSKSDKERTGNGSVIGTALKLLAILALKG